MNILQRLNKFADDLEQEFIGDALKISVLYDSEIRMVSVGVNHPLWHSFICDGRILPRHNYEPVIQELYKQFQHDLNIIDNEIRDNYGKDENVGE